MKKIKALGFSLIELILVMALIGIFASFSVVMSMGSLSKSAVVEERDLFITLLLRSTRTASLANIDNVAHGVFIDNNNHQYILFNGTTLNPVDPKNRIIPYSNNTLTFHLNGRNPIVFEQLSGNVIGGSSSIAITNGNATSTITIRKNGQIDW
jgi:prepilin-type N-terminal cleavage/methylation domain-containing protein